VTDGKDKLLLRMTAKVNKI